MDLQLLCRRGLLVAMTSTAACTGFEHLEPREMRSGYRFDPNGNHGAILGSIELVNSLLMQSLLALGAHVEDDGQARIALDSRPNMETTRLIPGPALLSKDFSDRAAGQSSVGNLFAVVLPPGTYSIWSLTLTTQTRSGSTRLPPLAFTVDRGRTSYIGNLLFQCGDFRVEAIAVRNRAERDLPLLQQRFPWVSAESTRVNVARSPLWPADLTAGST